MNTRRDDFRGKQIRGYNSERKHENGRSETEQRVYELLNRFTNTKSVVNVSTRLPRDTKAPFRCPRESFRSIPRRSEKGDSVIGSPFIVRY